MSEIKVTQREIDRLMDGAEVHGMTEFGKCTVVTVKLENGFILTESSACVDPENYNPALGKKLCLDRIENRLWELEGYALQKKEHERRLGGVCRANEDANEAASGDFGWALDRLRRGYRLRRRGWNGKGQYIELAENIRYDGPDSKGAEASHEDIGSKAIAFCGTRGVQMGWLASQSDMLAEDWELADVPHPPCGHLPPREGIEGSTSGMPRPTGEEEVRRVESTLPVLVGVKGKDVKLIRDPENDDTVWVELPDNLRLKFVNGRYAGWYTPELKEVLQ